MGELSGINEFEHLYKGSTVFTKQERLDQEIDIINDVGVEFFAKLLCSRLFDHTDIRRLKGHEIELFLKEIRPFVSWGKLAKRGLK